MDAFCEIFGGFPNYFATTMLQIHFRANPEQVQKLLPEGAEPSETEPGGCVCYFMDGLMIPKHDTDRIVVNPERTEFKESGIWLKCRINGVEALLNHRLWLDKDFPLVAGWLIGATPKSFGRVYLGHSKARLYELIDCLGPVRPGTRFTSCVEAYGERIITTTIKLSRTITMEELPTFRPIYGVLYVTPLETGSGGFSHKDGDKLKYELVNLTANHIGHPRMGKDIWFADVTQLSFTESLASMSALKPTDMTGAYLFDLGDNP